ncbi:hypothetical protein [Arthrobacter sp. H14]|uniref:hypothetical protein n=1 Tax=Arthrobacter sp. H14 TaxID=1312959 RepID=UPI000479A245|nr:hypothetical protein [Arthrobacter sp. H14]
MNQNNPKDRDATLAGLNPDNRSPAQIITDLVDPAKNQSMQPAMARDRMRKTLPHLDDGSFNEHFDKIIRISQDHRAMDGDPDSVGPHDPEPEDLDAAIRDAANADQKAREAR